MIIGGIIPGIYIANIVITISARKKDNISSLSNTAFYLMITSIILVVISSIIVYKDITDGLRQIGGTGFIINNILK